MKKKNLAEKIVETEKEKAKKTAKRKLRRAVRTCVGGLCLFCTGYFLGVHHRVIKALIKGEELPEAPKGHAAIDEK